MICQTKQEGLSRRYKPTKYALLIFVSYIVDNIVFVLQKNVNIEEDWKLITLWIGGNDLCAVCKGSVSHYLTRKNDSQMALLFFHCLIRINTYQRTMVARSEKL